jgi:Protein of unknown function (DUF1350)
MIPCVQSFDTCVEELRSSQKAWVVPEGVPVHGVGHSNGALMHLLIGSLAPKPVTSNVLISYNNKEVSDAIPIPGAQRTTFQDYMHATFAPRSPEYLAGISV